MIRGKQVTLRGLELEDAPEIIKHFNDLDVRRFLGGFLPFSREEEEEWIKRTWEGRQKGTEFQFGIELNTNQQLIGTCGLFDIHRINRSAELGIAIWNKQFWGQGLGTEAMQLLLSYGFYILNLHSIYLRVNEDNTRAIHVYEKVGFQHAVRQRQDLFQEGQYKDVLMMDLLEEEFRKLHPPPFDFIKTRKE